MKAAPTKIQALSNSFRTLFAASLVIAALGIGIPFVTAPGFYGRGYQTVHAPDVGVDRIGDLRIHEIQVAWSLVSAWCAADWLLVYCVVLDSVRVCAQHQELSLTLPHNSGFERNRDVT